MAVASQLLRHHKSELNGRSITIVDPSENHYYQPLWTLVGGGLKPIEESKRPMRELVERINADKKQLELLSLSVASVDPYVNTVKLSDGSEIKYDYLVVAAGIKTLYDKIPGLSEALANPDLKVTTNYHVDYASTTAKYIDEFKGGNAIFTQPSTPVKCAGAPQKIAYLAEEKWRARGIRSNTRVQFITGMGKIFAVDKYAKSLTQVCKSRDIQVKLCTDLVEIRPATSEAVFKTLSGPDEGKTFVEKFDFLHVMPPMGPHEFSKQSKLANAAGFIEVNPKTLQSIKYHNVFALGDCAGLPVSKTAAAVAAQSHYVTHNLISQMKADSDSTKVKSWKEYDGYTSCPLVTGKNSLILAEFNGFGPLAPKETFFFDQSVERSSMAFLNSEVLPRIYWDFMMRGDWIGPGPLRKFTNPTNSN